MATLNQPGQDNANTGSVTESKKSTKNEPQVAVEDDSIDITVPKLKIEKINMRFGGVRIAIHDADKG